MSTALLTLAAAVFGGAGVKAIEGLMSRGQDKDSLATELRAELRLCLKENKEELRLCTEETATAQGGEDKWRQKYYELLDQYIALHKSS